MYRTGIETKLNILAAARKLFHDRGFKPVTVNAISEEAGVKLGTFTYYFARKDDLIGAIYNDYMQACKDYVDAHAPLGLSPAEHHMYAVMLYYFKLYSDEKTAVFHRDVLKHGSMSAYFENPRAVIADFSEGENVDRDDPTYGLLVMADDAVRRELNLDFISQGEFELEDVRQLLTDIYTITARLFVTNRETLVSCIDQAYRFVEEHPEADVSLLG